MRLFGKHVFPRQIALFAAGSMAPEVFDWGCRLLFFGATTYDVHRSIKSNEQPPTREQMEALQDYINSRKQ
ncbi:hypothetical protein C2845_PM04G23630 [Panicum miliaceum]|uniref:Uncharacterized protein n=1 Tax=Panicum miliaceum TaxID=4540 RepID=A0A3L6QMW0_PANMI|nr:hypothetical protein C2845_PM04G23630 [Panicum miliaceum]